MDNIENASTAQEQAADQQTAFLEGWGDETPETEQAADQQTGEAEGAQQEAEGGDPAAAESAKAAGQKDGTAHPESEGAATGEEPGQPKQEAPPAPTWQIKHMGEEKTLAASDITPELLQKGLDYDRVRGKYDEAKPIVELFGQYAKQAKMSIADYVKHIRAEAKKAGGMSAEEAKRAVELEDREAAVSAKEAEQQEAQATEKDRKAKIAADLEEFSKAFPDVYAKAKSDPKAIPQSVWDKVNGGQLTLTAAYAVYAVAQANEQSKAAQQAQQAAEQNQRNAHRATGSMKSAGSDTKSANAFLAGFDG